MVSILVVEDDVTTQFLLTEFIETLGYRCQVASSADDCLRVLRENQTAFDLVLMDIHMPGKTGIDASQEIRRSVSKHMKELPIIAVTGDSKYHDVGYLRSQGIDEVLPKPVDLSQLDSTILRFAA